MKKSIALVALAFGVTNAFAQDLTSKKGEPFLPEAGDWGIAIDATPFLNYAGNMFGKTANNVAPTWNFLTTAQTITGRYFKDEKTVYRGSLRIGMNSNKQRNMVDDRLAAAALSPTANGYPAQTAQKENTWKSSSSTVGLAAGIEMRKGKTRLQGYYGGEVGVYVNMSKSKFEYGNALAATSTASLNVSVDAVDDNFGGSGNIGTPGINGLIGSARATEIKNGTVFSFGLRGFVGAEYFILPKISVGGEFGWGLGMTSTGKSKTTWESVGNNGNPANTSNSLGTTEIIGSKQNGLSLDTDGKNSVWGPTGTLRLNLYF
ncbi:MAG: hypothetical protein Q7W45_15320 [Bacteroidota bacterium]|nr:hypothetical protein [Bacteroidota bacterium]MDP3147263.1 hypothetical protein [Bacteroidota bacterium]